MAGIRVGIVGVGNCAMSLVQGVGFYRDAKPTERVPGLMHTVLGGYHVGDIRFVCGFDIDIRKVGRDLSEAVFAPPNNALRFADVHHLDAPVYRGPTLDGISPSMEQMAPERRFVPSLDDPVDVVERLREHQVEVLLLYLPVGSEQAARFYAEAALEAGCAVVNCLPVFLASDPHWAKRFEERGLPILGDDIKSQVGATIVHRSLARLFEDRGVSLAHTYQLNVGGNTDFLNMLERSRLSSKKTSKTAAVQAELTEPLAEEDIHIGPSDYVPFLKDNKVCFLRMEGRGFGNAPVEIEVRLSVQDSPNSAGVVIDAVRCARLALDRGEAGAITGPSSYFFKHPPVQHADAEGLRLTESFIMNGSSPHKRLEPTPRVISKR
jgi:myo-inositol-1-phosphate synthase